MGLWGVTKPTCDWEHSSRCCPNCGTESRYYTDHPLHPNDGKEYHYLTCDRCKKWWIDDPDGPSFLPFYSSKSMYMSGGA
eukprot:g76033.t1